MFLKRKNIHIEFKKKRKPSNVRNSRPHQDFKFKKKTDETKSNQTEPYPSIVTN